MFIIKGLNKLRRSRQIISVFTKYGLDYLFDLGRIDILTRIRKKSGQKHLNPAQKFCRALEELGPTFIKFGQLLSTRPDFLPPEFIKELEKLQDQTPPFDSLLAEQIIEQEFRKPVSELFKEFEQKPVAAASLSQVHKALLPDGEVVAVKIQRPGIKQIIELDMAILQDLAGFVEKRFHNGWTYRPQLMVEEFRKAISKELVFTREARNFEKFRINFSEIKYIRVPKIYWELTTSVVLTMEFIDGIKINEIVQDKYRELYDPREVAIRGTEAILKQILEDGFFHADPHPANLFVQPPADIIMLDVGMVGYLDKKTTIEGVRLVKAVVGRDAEKTMESFENLKIIVKDVDRNTLRQDLTELFDSYLGTPLKDLDISKVGQDVLGIMTRHNLTLPANLVLMIKALSMIESTGRDLYPELDLLTIAKPYVRKISENKLKAGELLKKSGIFLQESADLIENLPQDLNVIIHKMREGKLKFVFENQESDKLQRSISNAGTKISLGLIIAALIIGSSLLMNIQKPVLTLIGYREAGAAGYIIAAILCIVLIVSFTKLRK
jgi:ubiquinone biosynthesis protein